MLLLAVRRRANLMPSSVTCGPISFHLLWPVQPASKGSWSASCDDLQAANFARLFFDDVVRFVLVAGKESVQ